jgi:enolase
MSEIKKIKARQVLDSRGIPTVEAIVQTENNSAKAIVPSGTSTGKFEAIELRDKGKEFNGKSVLKAVKNVNEVIASKLIGRNVLEQKEIDSLMLEADASPNKANLGANAVLSVSMACARLAVKEKNVELFEYIGEIAKVSEFACQLPSVLMIEGGLHGGGNLKTQEHMVIPIGADSFSEALQMCTETYYSLKEIYLNCAFFYIK